MITRCSNLFLQNLLVFIFCIYTADVVDAEITRKPSGVLIDRRSIDVYTLRNTSGIEVRIMNFGGVILSLRVPDRNGKFDDIVLGFNSIEKYLPPDPYFGCIVGRYANRICHGKFLLDNKEYHLTVNNKENHLHGGTKGFSKVLWNGEIISGEEGEALKLTYKSLDGEEGYPGNLDASVIYKLTDDNDLRIDYLAVTDKPTIINLSNHSYFNLKGEGNGTVLDHMLEINAQRFTPVDSGMIPTGDVRDVKNTPMDFTKPIAIGSQINQKDEQLAFGLGYDHNWVLDTNGNLSTLAACVKEPTSGRVMEIFTTQPGMQFYSGNFLHGNVKGKTGKAYEYRSAIVLEPQHFPDSPNHSQFPSTVLRPGEAFKQSVIYRFKTF
jgi:aldose 1-epimerase